MKINKKLLMAALAGAIVVGGGVNTYAAEPAPAPAPEKKSQPAEKILTLDEAKEKAEKDAAAKKAEEEAAAKKLEEAKAQARATIETQDLSSTQKESFLDRVDEATSPE
ncbi:MAG: hypothetical protein E6703_06650, partial [Finegoldia magna]|nr:hypothetical protein [Finegoldia magna]